MNTTNLPTLTAKEQGIVNIISDSIVYARIHDGMYTVLNAFNPKYAEHNLKTKYNGTDNVYVFMDLDDEDLTGELSDIFYNAVFERGEDRRADELAVYIYFQWLKAIKEFYTTKKAS